MNTRLSLMLGCLLTVLSTTVFAQTSAYKLAYYGESFTHYGLRVGYERAFRSVDVSRRTRNINKTLLYSGNLAVYRHPHNHIGIILSPEIEWRRTARKGRFIEFAFSPSLYRFFYEGKTFEVNDSGNLEKVPLAGRTAFLPTLSFGFGKALFEKRNVPISWYSRVNLMRQFPYNASSLTRISIELGIIKKF